jgi:glycosyltransferase involved in cell wall biosynthesis
MDLAIEALPAIRARFPEARLVVAGEGPERHALEGLARQLGVGDAVAFPGWVSPAAVPAVMREASLVLMPSRRAEGFPLVALEAGHAERAVVASRIPGLDEAVAHGETGVLIPPDDPAALAAGAIDLLADPERATRLGRRGRRRALRLCDLDRSVDRHQQLYRQIVEEHHGYRASVRACQP